MTVLTLNFASEFQTKTQMKGLEIKFSEVGITTSANPQRKAMYFVVANVIDDKGKKHRHYLDIDMLDSKKVPI